MNLLAIRLLIIEDEQHNSRMLADMLRSIRPGWTIEAIIESVAESVEWLQQNSHPDLILMDIQLSDGICFSIFKQIELETNCKIIFTTAYDEYAIQAFKVNSIDYLLKPVKKEDLELAFQKYEELFLKNLPTIDETLNYSKIIDSILKGEKQYRTRFLISGIHEYKRIFTEDIAYFYSSNKLTFAVDFKGKEYTIDYNLEQLESELHPNYFFRANRKIILHINAITKVVNESGSKLRVECSPKTDFEIIVSRLKATEFKYWLGK